MRAKERLPYLVASAIALALLWQARALESWTFLGPGPGLFPQLTTGAAAAIAILLACCPGLAAGGSRDAEIEAQPRLAGEDRRRFLVYCLALPFLAFGAAFLGFVATSLCLALALTWHAERHPWPRALAFGAICGVAGLIGFGRLLGATLPETAIEQGLLALLR